MKVQYKITPVIGLKNHMVLILPGSRGEFSHKSFKREVLSYSELKSGWHNGLHASLES